jgi:hypothetical protein
MNGQYLRKQKRTNTAANIFRVIPQRCGIFFLGQEQGVMSDES